MTESKEIQKLKEIIADKRKYYEKLSNDYARKKLQSEILFLEREILPIIARETTLLYSEATRFFEASISRALKEECDAVLVFFPFWDITDKCTIGVINPKTQKFGKENIDSIEISIDDMGVGGRKIEIENIEL